MEVHGYTFAGSIDATIDGKHLSVPDDFENGHRQMIARWESEGNTIPPYVPSKVDHWGELRSERNRRLRESDWVILRNLETSEPVPEVWLSYRQALRDLPANTTDPANPDWPEAPTT